MEKAEVTPEFDYIIKILMEGADGSGKTSLSMQFVDGNILTIHIPFVSSIILNTVFWSQNILNLLFVIKYKLLIYKW